MWKEYVWVILFCAGLFIWMYLITSKIFAQKSVKSKLSVPNKKTKSTGRNGVSNLLFTRFKEKVIKLIPLTPESDLENTIILSNTKYRLEDILFFKIVMAIIMFLLSIFLSQNFTNLILKIIVILIFILAGYRLPNFSLKLKVKKRKKSIKHALPAFIDYLIICVEAGMGLDMAIGNVAIKMNNALSQELLKAVNEMNYGRSRKEALTNLSERLNIPEATSFFNAIISSEHLGISIGQILKVQGEEMRQKKKQQIQEKAYKLPVKMIFPMVFFILPGLFIVLLGPAVIQIFQMFLK